MKFERKAPDVVVAFTTCQTRNYWDGSPKKVTTAVRAIRERSGKWRADKAAAVAGTWAPWEPVVSTEFRTLTEAKKALRDFAKSCRVLPPRGMSGARRRRR